MGRTVLALCGGDEQPVWCRERIRVNIGRVLSQKATVRLGWDLLTSSFDSGNLQLVLDMMVVGQTVLASC